MGILQGDIVPLRFEKSKLVPVAVLAVMKAGATCVLLDSTLPNERLRSIIRQVSPKLILTSAALEARDQAAHVYEVPRIRLDEEAASRAKYSAPFTQLPAVDPSTVLYIVFTSGSTGVSVTVCICVSVIC